MPTVPNRRLPGLGWLLRPLVLVLLLGGIFSLVWIRTRVMEVRYEIGELESIRMERLSQQRRLIASRTTFAAPSRVAFRARRLGLIEPDRGRVFRVRYQPRAVPVRSSHRSGSSVPAL